MKSYTDLGQSKKLAEILPIESADMHYATWTIFDGEFVVSQNQGSTIKRLQEDYGNQIIPCWSLAALLEVLPETIEDKYGDYDLTINMIYKKPEYVRVCDCYHSDFPSWDWDNEELLDNIVNAIIWLHNNNLLK